MGAVLDPVGLSEPAELVYTALVENSPTPAQDLGNKTGLDPQQLDASLLALEAKGLIYRHHGTPLSYSAVAPDIALGVLIADKENQLKRARLSAEHLALQFREMAGRRESSGLIEVVSGAEPVTELIRQLQRTAEQEVRWIDKPPYLGSPAVTSQVECDQLERGVRYRVVYDSSALDHHELRGDIEATIRRGEQARLLPGTPVKLALIDDRFACLPLAGSPGEITAAVVVHPSGLLEALSALFEELWDRALPLTPNLTVAQHSVSADDRRLLVLLTAGVSDSKAAKQLGVSPRTYQRRIQALMDRLGVSTRFQAGLQAALLGWTTPGPR